MKKTALRLFAAGVLAFCLFGTTACGSEDSYQQESYDSGNTADYSDVSSEGSEDIVSEQNVEPNVLYLNIGGQLYRHVLQSCTEVTEWNASFVATDENGNAVSFVTVLIPGDACAGDEFTSEDSVDQVNGNGGILLYDAGAGKSFSALNTNNINSENDYFGIGQMAGDNQFVLIIDYVGDDGLVTGRFAAEYAHSDYGSGDPLSVGESTFAIDFANLPVPQESNAGTAEDPFADDTWNDVLGPVEPGDISSGGTDAGGGTCQYCQGTGIKSVCTLCNGFGSNGNDADVLYNGAYVCPSCLGTGVIDCIHCEDGIAY